MGFDHLWALVCAAAKDDATLSASMRTALAAPWSKVLGAEGGARASVETTRIDSSYLAFLNEQIALKPRGKEWNLLLEARLAALQQFVGVDLVHFFLSWDERSLSAWVNPRSGALVLLEVL